MYDKDNSGTIELSEMIEIIGTLYEMEGVSKVCLSISDIITKISHYYHVLWKAVQIYFSCIQENAAERARKIFTELDINGDGELDCDEFVKGCMDDKDLLQTLNGAELRPQDGQRKYKP